MRKRVIRAISGATAIASGMAAGMAAIAAASAAPAVTIACGDVAGLKAAINAANTGGPSEIDLAPNCAYTLTTADNTSSTEGSNGLPIVRKTVDLVGSNSTIERSSTADFRILEVAGTGGNPASLTIHGITISGGHASGLTGNAGRGGCLLSTYTGTTPTASRLSLSASEVEDCAAALAGGGIYAGSLATLTVGGSSVKDNQAGAGGGAEVADNASGTFDRSFVNGNAAARGGGLGVGGDVSLTTSTLAGNSATIAGAGLYNDGRASLGTSYVLSNQGLAGGGIYATTAARTSLVGTAVQGNVAVVRGGGLDNNGHAYLQNSFVVTNTAPIGGGIYEALSGSIVVLNSLIVGNTVNNCSPLASVPFCVN